MRLRLAISATVLLAACSGQHPDAPANPPIAAIGAACRPTFLVDGQELQAGTAFLVEPAPGAPPLIVTALHLLGPDGGVPVQIAAEQLPARVRLVRCERLDGKGSVPGGPALAISGTQPYQAGGTLRDIAAFRTENAVDAKAPRLKLAASDPAAGDPIWMVSRVANRRAGQLLYRAGVERNGPEALEYRFDDAAIDLKATSGAPVVNAAGELVGVNLVSYEDKTELAGGADTPAVIKAALARAR